MTNRCKTQCKKARVKERRKEGRNERRKEGRKGSDRRNMARREGDGEGLFQMIKGNGEAGFKVGGKTFLKTERKWEKMEVMFDDGGAEEKWKEMGCGGDGVEIGKWERQGDIKEW